MAKRSEIQADHGAALDFMQQYELVRGWRLRRFYMVTKEIASLAMVTPRSPVAGNWYFDGAEVRRVRSQEVANAIREWDLQP